jgi:exosortase/archaeosortase family protein
MPFNTILFWYKNPTCRFLVFFLCGFLFLYYFNLFFIGITSPGNYYSSFLDQHFNYIRGLRALLLQTSSKVLTAQGYKVYVSDYTLHAMNVGGVNVVYSCLGFGVMSFFTAFVIAWPDKSAKNKLIFLLVGLVLIQLLNIARFILITLYYKGSLFLGMDHHTLFNSILYLILMIMIYIWINYSKNTLQRQL